MVEHRSPSGWRVPPGEQRARLAARQAQLQTRLQATWKQVEGTPAGLLTLRLRQADLWTQAITFAALGLMLLFPFMITLAAVSPVRQTGAADLLIRKMGLDPRAATAVQQLFATNGGSAAAGWTVLGAVFLVIGALAVAEALQATYLGVWMVPVIGPVRRWIAQICWLAGLVVSTAVHLIVAGTLSGSAAGRAVQAAFAVVWGFLFTWWGAWVLTAGRVSWRHLRPTALCTTVGLAGLGWFSKLYFSSSIVSNNASYGEIGVVFVLLSWLMGVSVVLTGGAAVGMWYVENGLSVLRTARRLLHRLSWVIPH